MCFVQISNVEYRAFKVCKNPNAVVFEHNTKELEEAVLNVTKLKSKISFSLRPSIFFNYIEQIILPVYIERRRTKKVLQYAKAGVCVTHELAEYEKEVSCL